MTGRFLGIDFGTKNVGLAVSDEGGTIAFPYTVFPNNSQLLEEIHKVIKERKVQAVVMGRSTDFKGEDNPLMRAIKTFQRKLEQQSHVTVHLEDEVLSSKQAERLQGNISKLDASAAAIILQAYLDKQRHAK